MIEEANHRSAADRSVGELVSDLVDEVKRLVRDELRIAVFELRHKGKRMGRGAGLFGVSGVLALLGGMTLVACAVLALAIVMPAWLSALLIGGGLLVLAGLTALVGKHEVTQATPPVPEEAIAGLRDDARTVQKGMRS